MPAERRKRRGAFARIGNLAGSAGEDDGCPMQGKPVRLVNLLPVPSTRSATLRVQPHHRSECVTAQHAPGYRSIEDGYLIGADFGSTRLVTQQAGPNDATYGTGNPMASAPIQGKTAFDSSIILDLPIRPTALIRRFTPDGVCEQDSSSPKESSRAFVVEFASDGVALLVVLDFGVELLQ